jgi:hypothetical protein
MRDNDYFVSDTNYGWGPADADLGYETIGDHTNIGSWWNWFRGPHSSTYLPALYAESGQNSYYSRLGTDPGGQNRMIMFKSCFPNSGLGGSPSDPVPPIGSNPLRGSESTDAGTLTVANAKGIYIDLLDHFRTRQDKLFIVITAPPLTEPTYAPNARAFNNWLVNDWLSGYPYKNVFVFDFYNALTSNGGSPNVNDAGQTGGNHHRWWNGAVQHQVAYRGNTLAYALADGHPNGHGNQKATSEYRDLLNVAYNRWQNSPPVPPPSQWKSKFYFAEGYTGDNFQEYACLENPNAAPAAVWVTAMFTDGTSQSQYFAVDAASRLTVDINSLFGGGRELSMRVVSTSEDVVAERPMYFNYLGKWSGGHDVVGAVAPAADWYFAEGTTRAGFEEWLCIQNPNAAPISVSARYLLGPGQGVPVTRTYPVPAKQRLTVSVNQAVGAEKDVSVRLTSADEFIAERPMYFMYHGAWDGGHDVIGGAPSTTALFAESYTGPGFEEWLCLQNAGSSAAGVTVTYYPEGAASIVKHHTVAANSRYTMDVNSDAGAGLSISAKVTSDRPLMVERPMYFCFQGKWTGGHDVAGFAPAP